MKPNALEEIFSRALAGLDPAVRVHDALRSPPVSDRVRVVAIGKAAPAMVLGAMKRWGSAIEHVLVVAPDGAKRVRGAETIIAAHPLPDLRSVRAAERCIALVSAPSSSSILVLALLSGGASSLVCAPIANVTLARKRAVASAMLRSGASVQEINVVRKHLSRIKGGGLVRAAAKRSVLTLVVSDVIGGRASDVGSGPTVSDDSSVADARRLLRRYAPRFADVPLGSTLARAAHVRARIIVRPEELAHLVATGLSSSGVAARVLPPAADDVHVLAASYVALARRLGRKSAVVRVAEPALVVPARAGQGGRSTHLAALVARDLPPDVLLFAAATDGVDGGSGTAGAIVDGRFATRVARARIDDALSRFDTGLLHHRFGSARTEGTTGHNLADLHVLLRR